MRPLIIDNFAGGGGASTGIERALGRVVDIAINHDPEAVAMHLANHPETKHFCQSIMAVDPLEATGGQPVALAWFSPDCKHHSKAKGGKPREKNIRDLAWIVVHWAERLRKATPGGRGAPAVIMLENVEEFRQWGPLNADGKPIPERKGEEFDLWVRGLKRQGYKVEWRELRACDYGAPTSRKRLFLIARRDGLPIVWPEPTHGKPGSAEVVSGQRKPWRTAAECIDWSIPCPSIFNRKRPLKDATHRRIAHGVMRYVVNAKRPFIVANNTNNVPRSTDAPVATVTTGNRLFVADAAIVPITHTANGPTAHDPADPLRTVTTANGGELARATVTIAPLPSAPGGSPADEVKHDDESDCGRPCRLAGASDNDRPVRVSGCNGKHDNGRAEHDARLLRDQHSNAEDCGGRAPDGHLIAPHITKFRTGSIGSDAGGPVPTVTANGDSARPAGATPLGIAAATMVQMGYGEREGQAPRALDVETPLGTVVAGGGKHGQVTAFLSHFYTSNTNGGQGDPLQPAKTVTSEGQHHAVVCAHMEQANTGRVGHPATAPVSTITSAGAHQRLIETRLIEADALPPEQLARAVQVAAFLVKYYGAAEHGQALDRPIDTVTSLARFAVVTVTIDAVTYVIVDIGMRMLTRRELANAQGFPPGYILDPIGPNGKPLTISSSIRMIGNSVCPDMAEALARANVRLDQFERVAA